MVHVTDMGQEGFVKDAGDVVQIGQKIQVRVKKIDEMGRIQPAALIRLRLIMRAPS
jgi:predicted RNA-binding protein with RPS1 domain